jgi:hypothetical protein
MEPNKGEPVELELVVHTTHLIVGRSSIGQTIADKHICMQQRVKQGGAGAQLCCHCGPPLGLP